MKTLQELANSIDYKLLREQKAQCLEIVWDGDEYLFLEGIIALIDNLQDTIVEAGIKTEEEVFGTNKNE